MNPTKEATQADFGGFGKRCFSREEQMFSKVEGSIGRFPLFCRTYPQPYPQAGKTSPIF